MRERKGLSCPLLVYGRSLYGEHQTSMSCPLTCLQMCEMVECLSRRTWLTDQQLCALSDAFSDEVCASAGGPSLLKSRAGYTDVCVY